MVSNEIKRVKTGIKGLDEIIQGGFPEGSSILVAGSPGTGKTIFGLEYIHNGVAKFKERGLYVSFEQSVEDLIQQAALFGWDLNKLIKGGGLEVIYIPVTEITPETVKKIIDKIKTKKIRRLVVDSISTLSVNAPIYRGLDNLSLVDISEKKAFFSPPILGDFIVKRFIYYFIDALHKTDGICTSLLTSEAPEKGEYISRDTISEFVCDGVVLLQYLEYAAEGTPRTLLIRKMRKTKHEKDIFPFEINERGIEVSKPKKGVVV